VSRESREVTHLLPPGGQPRAGAEEESEDDGGRYRAVRSNIRIEALPIAGTGGDTCSVCVCVCVCGPDVNTASSTAHYVLGNGVVITRMDVPFRVFVFLFHH